LELREGITPLTDDCRVSATTAGKLEIRHMGRAAALAALLRRAAIKIKA
jgi:hypothetical protein